jgi:hypothetical protein
MLRRLVPPYKGSRVEYVGELDQLGQGGGGHNMGGFSSILFILWGFPSCIYVICVCVCVCVCVSVYESLVMRVQYPFPKLM